MMVLVLLPTVASKDETIHLFQCVLSERHECVFGRLHRVREEIASAEETTKDGIVVFIVGRIVVVFVLSSSSC